MDSEELPEAFYRQQIRNLIWDNLNTEFKKTRKSLYASLLGPLVALSYFQVFNRSHPAKWASVISAFLGGAFHCYYSLANELYEVCGTDTKVAAQLRFCHQQISKNNLLFPYYKEETLRVVEHRKQT